MSASQLHRFLMRAAFSGAYIFAWIAAFHALWILSGSMVAAFTGVAITYALMHTVTILALPLAARNMRHGSRRTLEAAILSAAAAFAGIGGFYLTSDLSFTWVMGGFALLMGIYRALYYVPYELSRGGSSRIAFLEILIALMPACAGVLIATGFHMPQTLYFAAAAICVLALLPIYFMPDKHEGFSWSYRQTFHELFAPQHRTLLAISVTEGLEATTLLLVWPISIWLLVEQSYPLLGVILSSTLLLTMVSRLVLRRLGVVPTPVVAAAISVSGWALRYFAGNAVSVMLIDAYAHAPTDPRKKGFDLATHEHVVDNHTYVDEYTALKEMGNALGRILMCALIVLLSLSLNPALVVGGAFVGAASASVATILLMRGHRRSAF